MAKHRRQNRHNFHPGSRGGCEALLWEFRESDLPRDPEPNDKNTLSAVRVVMIAATTLDEALSYLRFNTPDFVVDAVKCLGIIILISGSPLD